MFWKKYKKFIYIGVPVLLVLLVVGKKNGWIGKENSLQVAIEKPAYRTIVETITANGKIQPETEVKMSPDVSGEIIDLYVKEGQDVKKGDLLLKIRPYNYISARDRSQSAVDGAHASLSNAKARLEQYEAQLEQAKLTFERNEKLWQQGVISKSDWEAAQVSLKVAKSNTEAARQEVRSAEFNIKSAEAGLNEAELNLSKTNIYAPMDGTISKLLVEKGERVVGTEMMSGTEMMRVADLSRMELRVDVNENDIPKVKLGDTAVIEVDAYLGQKFKGIVTQIANSANVSGTTSSDQLTNFEVRILLLKESYKTLLDKGIRDPFRPGMSATADIRTNVKYNVLSIPIQSVTARADSASPKQPKPEANAQSGETVVNKANTSLTVAFVVKNGMTHQTILTTGIQDNNYIEILSGIGADDEVVIAPYSAISRKLNNDTKVKVVKESELYKK
jgi:HlyD family secretion protein